MNVEKLVELIHSGNLDNWKERNQEAFDSLFGSPNGRYELDAKKSIDLRASVVKDESGGAFASYLNPSNQKSGAYGGFSFVIFPTAGRPFLIGLGVGKGGLQPDQAVLERPGHARKAQAICKWLNAKYGKNETVAWAKSDPTNRQSFVPKGILNEWNEFTNPLKQYEDVMYALFRPNEGNKAPTTEAVMALLDFTLEERGQKPIKRHQDESARIKKEWAQFIMPNLSSNDVWDLLSNQRFVIIQGPPGTGKTEMARGLLHDKFQDNGKLVQFHPSTTYETVIGGLAPNETAGGFGFSFAPTPGAIMTASIEAKDSSPKPYLLCIDEINRADLGKVLGEAIFLLEPKQPTRTISLPYEFKKIGKTFSLPENLYILGTMNSADRSIGALDVAVRRRFAFASLWPQVKVVEENSCPLMHEAFLKLMNIFVEFATDDTLNLMPGHSYFLEDDDKKAPKGLRSGVAPLLEEYLVQGYVSGFGDEIRGYLQWLESR